MSRSKKILLSLIVVLQVVSIIIFVVIQEVRFSESKIITLQTQPVDPRDIFRGDYVILDYEISHLTENTTKRNGSDITTCCYYEFWDETDKDVYVFLKPAGDVWQAFGISSSYDGDNLFSNTDSNISEFIRVKGKLTTVDNIERIDGEENFRELEITYGIENYFVQVDTGKTIETADDVKVNVKVNKHGDSQIESLLVDGNIWP
ncbi:MAG: GDYXXLXY domain-containing protein [Dehalococcoidia bacterium]